MKRLALLVFGFAVGTLLPIARAQEEAPPHGQHDLTVRDILDILGEYDLRHVDPSIFPPALYGLTDYEAAQPTIWIMNRGDLRSRKSTVIHELVHIHYRNIGITPSEEFINAEEERQYAKVYGGQP